MTFSDDPTFNESLVHEVIDNLTSTEPRLVYVLIHLLNRLADTTLAFEPGMSTAAIQLLERLMEVSLRRINPV